MEWVSAVSGLNSHETHKRPQREEFLGADIFGASRIAAILILCTDDNDKGDDDPDDIGTEECKLAFGMIAPKARHIIAWRGHDPSKHTCTLSCVFLQSMPHQDDARTTSTTRATKNAPDAKTTM